MIVVGMFAASIAIGGGVALILGYLTKLTAGTWEAHTIFYGWGVFISPVLGFFAAKYTLILTFQTLHS